MLYKVKTARVLYYPGLGYLTNGREIELNDAQYEKLKRRCCLIPVEEEKAKSVFVEETKPGNSTNESIRPSDKAVFERNYEEEDLLKDDDEEIIVPEGEYDYEREDAKAPANPSETINKADSNRDKNFQAQQQRHQQMNNGRPPKNKNNEHK